VLIILVAALITLPGVWSYLAAPDVDPSALRGAVAPAVPPWPEGLSPTEGLSPAEGLLPAEGLSHTEGLSPSPLPSTMGGPQSETTDR
jgi:hypothetical protein